LDEGVEFALAGNRLFGREQGVRLVQVRGGDFGVVRIALKDLIVVLDGCCWLLSAEVHLAEIEIGVAGEVVVGVGLDEVVELGRG
jgi:hypothetical protein